METNFLSYKCMSQSNFQVGVLYYFGVGFFFNFYETVATRDRVGSVGCVLDIHVNNVYCKTTGKFLYHQVLKDVSFCVDGPDSFGNRKGSESTCYSSNYEYNAGLKFTVERRGSKYFTFALYLHNYLNTYWYNTCICFHYHQQNA